MLCGNKPAPAPTRRPTAAHQRRDSELKPEHGKNNKRWAAPSLDALKCGVRIKWRALTKWKLHETGDRLAERITPANGRSKWRRTKGATRPSCHC